MNKKLKIILFIILIILVGVGFYFISINYQNIKTGDKIPNNLSKGSTKIVDLTSDVREKPGMDSGYKFTSDNIKIGANEGDHIYLTFDNSINGNESIDNFRKYLQLENTVVNISLPEMTVKGSDDVPRISEFDQVVRDNMKINFLSYENGKLKGILTTKASKADYWVHDNNDPECMTGDMMGLCVKTLPIDINLIINFEVQVK